MITKICCINLTDKMFEYHISSDNELQKTCDIYKKRLEDRKKAFKESLNSTAAKVKGFTVKHKMSEDEKYLGEIQQIGRDIEEFTEEVCWTFYSLLFIVIQGSVLNAIL